MSAVSSPSKKSKDFPGNSGDSAKKPVSSEKIEGQALPSNLDAEQGILAACIVDASGEVISNCIERALRPGKISTLLNIS